MAATIRMAMMETVHAAVLMPSWYPASRYEKPPLRSRRNRGLVVVVEF
jgi:hypothetical protein